MLTPEYLMQAADPVVEIYSRVEQDILEDIARRVVKTGYFTDTAQWQLKKAKEFGYLQGNVQDILAKATGLSQKEVQKLMTAAGTKSLAFDDAIYKAAGMSPVAVSQSPALMAMLLQGVDTTMALIGNYTKTTAKVSTVAFNSILDRAYIQIISGAFDPTTALKRAIKELATSGIEKIAYPSGATASIETAVRRAVTTGVNQSVAKLQLLRAEEMGCELVETSSHAGARPSHAEWQGKVFCIKGHHKRYGDFYRETGYGTGGGLCGWNCYHSFYPYFEGLSTPSFSHDPSKDAGRSNDEDYERQQKQRYYERKLRDAKKECSTFDAAMKAAQSDELHDELYNEFQRASVKLKQREARLREFIDETGRTRLRDREWTGTWNRSTSSKAVWANRRSN
nr:MAG TPA: minor capsid protein [Caudoviricetes sp.]